MVLFFVALNIGFIGVIYKCFSETLTFVVVVVIVGNVMWLHLLLLIPLYGHKRRGPLRNYGPSPKMN